MENTSKGGAPRPLRHFTKEAAVAALTRGVGKPSGVIVNIGDMDFDLKPLSNAKMLEAFSLVKRLSLMQGNASTSIDSLAAFLDEEGRQIISLAHDILEDAIEFEERGKEFDEWFDALPPIDTIKTLIPAIIKANGLGGILNQKSDDGSKKDEEAPIPELELATTVIQ